MSCSDRTTGRSSCIRRTRRTRAAAADAAWTRRSARGGAQPPRRRRRVPLTGAKDTVANRGFIAFEPMVGITDSMNLAHKGLYKELQSIPPGGTWEESFWLRPTGF